MNGSFFKGQKIALAGASGWLRAIKEESTPSLALSLR
jgi:hypothetical protein